MAGSAVMCKLWLSCGDRHLDQPQVPTHRMEIAVIVKQWPAVLDAPGADQQVDCLADGDAAPAQGTEIAGSCDCNCVTGHCHNFKAAQQSLDVSGGPFASQALQYLAKHQVANDDLLCTESEA
jgi:hypothetical protein